MHYLKLFNIFGLNLYEGNIYKLLICVFRWVGVGERQEIIKIFCSLMYFGHLVTMWVVSLPLHMLRPVIWKWNRSGWSSFIHYTTLFRKCLKYTTVLHGRLLVLQIIKIRRFINTIKKHLSNYMIGRFKITHLNIIL